jgi:dCMP deaminase
MFKKLTKEEYYLGIAKAVAMKSNCRNVAFGALIVRDDQIISTGYVGSPRKTKDCIDLGFCIRRENNIESGRGYEMCRSVHSEMNCIINAARAGVSLLDGTMYLYTAKREESGLVEVKAYPCLLCKKMIINAGLKKFIGNNPDGSISTYIVDDWVREWQVMDDITKDPEQYKVEYSKLGSNNRSLT